MLNIATVSRAALCVMIGIAFVWPAAAKNLSLTAEPGHIVSQDIGKSGPKQSITVSLQLTSSTPSVKWRPMAGVGFRVDSDFRNSVQVRALHRRPQDDDLSLLYFVYENGEEIETHSLGLLPLKKMSELTLTFDKGVVTIKMPGRDVETITTKLTEAIRYIAVSSGSAEFEIKPSTAPAKPAEQAK